MRIKNTMIPSIAKIFSSAVSANGINVLNKKRGKKEQQLKNHGKTN